MQKRQSYAGWVLSIIKFKHRIVSFNQKHSKLVTSFCYFYIQSVYPTKIQMPESLKYFCSAKITFR